MSAGGASISIPQGALAGAATGSGTGRLRVDSRGGTRHGE